MVLGDEQCDDGDPADDDDNKSNTNDGSYGSCTLSCKRGPHCGDGNPDAGHEDCDTGNNTFVWVANAAALPDRQVDALAWCLWSRAHSPDEMGVAFAGDCDALAAPLGPDLVTEAQALADSF